MTSSRILIFSVMFIVAGSILLFNSSCNSRADDFPENDVHDSSNNGNSDGDADGDADGDSDGDADGDSDGDGDSDTDGDGDSDTGSEIADSDSTSEETETDTEIVDLTLGDEACPHVKWGDGFPDDSTNGFPEGAILPNWIHKGYLDRDGDNLVEETDVLFDFCYLHKNSAKKSIFFILGDTTCVSCPDKYREIAPFYQDIMDAHGSLFLIETNQYQNMATPMVKKAFDKFFDGTFISGELLPVTWPTWRPVLVVVDVATMGVILFELNNDTVSTEDIIDKIVSHGNR